MNKITKILAAAILFVVGCQESTIPVTARVDERPTTILSLYSNGLPFQTNKAIAIATLGDTVSNEFVAIDEDKLVSYRMVAGNATTLLSEAEDTLTVRFGLIADSAFFSVGRVNTEQVIITDALGFETILEFETYIKSN